MGSQLLSFAPKKSQAGLEALIAPEEIPRELCAFGRSPVPLGMDPCELGLYAHVRRAHAASAPPTASSPPADPAGEVGPSAGKASASAEASAAPASPPGGRAPAAVAIMLCRAEYRGRETGWRPLPPAGFDRIIASHSAPPAAAAAVEGASFSSSTGVPSETNEGEDQEVFRDKD